MKVFLTAIILYLSLSGMAQEVLKLSENDVPGMAGIRQLDWLTGYWRGTGLGGQCDELWMPATDSSMAGVFRLEKGGKIIFSEYMVIQEEGGSLVLRLKHFNRDLTPWEEVEKWTTFRLVRISGKTAWFSGLTYHREGDQLRILLSMRSGEKTRTEEFRFEKTDL
jgi:hypothetical protein